MSTRIEWLNAEQEPVVPVTFERGEELVDGNTVTQPLALAIGGLIIEGERETLVKIIGDAHRALAARSPQSEMKVLIDDAVTLMIEACDTDDVLWETRATGQDTEEAESSGMLVGYKEALEAVQRLLNHGDAGPLKERLKLAREEMQDAQQEVEEAKPGEIHFWASGEERMEALNEALAELGGDETMNAELADAKGRPDVAHPDAEALTVADALRHVQQMHPLDLAARVEDIHMIGESYPSTCPTCKGTGGGEYNDCPTCGGNGVV